MKDAARKIIQALEDENFYAECPCCNDEIRLREAGLFYLDDFTPESEKLYRRLLEELKEREKEIRERRKEISERS